MTVRILLLKSIHVLFLIPCWSVSVYRQEILLAKCEARCYEKFGEVNRRDGTIPPDILIPHGCEKTRCSTCVKGCENYTNLTDCSGSCNGDSDCIDSCGFLYSSSKYVVLTSNNVDVKVSYPRLLCQRTRYESAEVILSWNVINVTEERPCSVSYPAVYLFQMRDRRLEVDGLWGLLGRGQYGLVPISGLRFSTEYQFRLTVVTPMGLLMPLLNSDWIRTVDKQTVLSPPKNIKVSEFIQERYRLTALLKWDLSKEKACFYKMYWLPDSPSASSGSKFISNPQDLFGVSLRNLELGTNYTVHIRSSDEKFESESAVEEAWFETPPCAEIFGNNASNCRKEEIKSQTVPNIRIERPRRGLFLKNSNAMEIALGVVAGTLFLVGGLFSVYWCRKKIVVTVDDMKSPSMINLQVRHPCPYRVNFSQLCLDDVIGRGAFGVVRKGILTVGKHKEVVAVKMLHDCTISEERKQLMQEIEFLKLLGRHPQLVNLIAYAIDGNQIAMLIEFCPLGDLRSYLINMQKDVFNLDRSDTKESGFGSMMSRSGSPSSISTHANEKEVIDFEQIWDVSCIQLLSFARQVSMGMDFLSSNRIVHRDLAARNVLVCDQDRVKITDFGLSRDIYEDGLYKKETTGKVPIKWLAMESISHHVYTSKSDVWSFGVLLWEVVTLGSTPYPGFPNQAILTLLQNGYRMERPQHCSEELYSIMTSCWKENPSERPCFKRVTTEIEDILSKKQSYFQIF